MARKIFALHFSSDLIYGPF